MKLIVKSLGPVFVSDDLPMVVKLSHVPFCRFKGNVRSAILSNFAQRPVSCPYLGTFSRQSH